MAMTRLQVASSTIVRCLRDRDGEGAADAMRRHIASTRRVLDRLLEDD